MTNYSPILLCILLLIGTACPPSAWGQVGALDPSFDGDGMRIDTYDVHDVAFTPVIDGDGKILVFGRSEVIGSPNTGQARVAHHNPDGSLDQSWTFNNRVFGCVHVPDYFYDGLIEPDGSIIAAGLTQESCSGSGATFLIVRYDSPGGNSSPFFSDLTEFYGGPNGAIAVARQDDGKLVTAGYAYGASRDVALARHNADGTLDEAFGTDGEVAIDVAGDEDLLEAVVVQPDGKIVAAGNATLNGQSDGFLMRLNADGTLDPSFDTDGTVTADFAGADDLLRDVELQADGKIVVAGFVTDSDGDRQFAAMRYETDGSLDPSFGSGGIVLVDFTGLPAAARDVVLQLDGKIVAVGWTETGSGGDLTRDFAIARLLPDGTLDSAFDGDGKNTADLSGAGDLALGATLQPDGNVVAVGFAEYADEARDFALARFLGDSGPLPVELTVFDAVVEGTDVVLRWRTASETNNAGFEVQTRARARADAPWSTVGYVEGSGTTSTPRTYRHRVDDLSWGVHQFRLKQVDLDGTTSFSSVVEVQVGGPLQFALHGAYPNPSSGVATISFDVARTAPVRMEIYDVLGRQVAIPVDDEYAPGRHRAQLDTSRLPAGLYVCRVRMGDVQASRTLTVVR